MIAPVGNDKIHTTEKLAQALEAANDDQLAPLIQRARDGHYHDFLSPLAAPAIQLVHDLRAAGHPELAQRVINGEFDASGAEAAAWKSSPEGRATFEELTRKHDSRP